ncbi:c-type cytochrome biogenesis protein CcsB [Sinomonas sp. ASV486]|uniref:c-type cytochrome biogenesis protein CcsB n=1 Tax=Sinomonas sp. ASV486 TaxID=3051170 RepID=UPI0027DCF083|nr:c-type cytochrome biogenesis protein CcsB [Sinomonas sp. ASV486]MDQ4492037.1 c-type cytochrome biogenesis protein CcsB [Sinomonas sp. ASV486]
MPTINFTLGAYSELFMLLAAGTYVVAFLAFAWDMATSGKVAQRDAALLAGQKALVTQAETAAKRPALAGVGSAAGGGAGGGTGGDASDGAAGGAPSSSVKNSGSPNGGVAPVEVADADLKYRSRRKAARVGVSLSILGLVIHAAGVVTRGIAAGRVPWGNMYEFCTTGALLVVAVFLLVLIRRDLRFLGTFVLGLAVVMMVAAAVAFYIPVGHLVPALQSYWLVIHVSIAVMSSALFTLTFSMAVLQLIQSRREAKIAAGGLDTGGFMRLVPGSMTLEALSYRINTIAFVGWTLTVMFGAIWAEKAWGRFWGWDTKEVWSFVIWVVYAAYLHARATRGWTGARAAWLSIVGYLCVLFNFTIVNVYFSGLHSYGGVSAG